MIPPNGIFDCKIRFVQAMNQDGFCVSRIGKDGLPNFSIYVERADEETMAETLAHELGHMLSQIFRTPAHHKDPRFGRVQKRAQKRIKDGDMAEDELIRILETEQEAWTAALKIRPGIRESEIDRSMESYL